MNFSPPKSIISGQNSGDKKLTTEVGLAFSQSALLVVQATFFHQWERALENGWFVLMGIMLLLAFGFQITQRMFFKSRPEDGHPGVPAQHRTVKNRKNRVSSPDQPS